MIRNPYFFIRYAYVAARDSLNDAVRVSGFPRQRRRERHRKRHDSGPHDSDTNASNGAVSASVVSFSTTMALAAVVSWPFQQATMNETADRVRIVDVKALSGDG
jgi:hypothetical protein